MALLTADDILNKKFTATKFREGYDVVEVDDFLDEVLHTPAEPEPQPEPEVEAAPEPAAAPEPTPAPTRAMAAEAHQTSVSSRTNEPESATGMLQLAQKLHDDYVRSGQDEGERLVTEARTEGDRIVREAQETSDRTLAQLEQERSLLERKIDELRQFERDYRTRLQSYLESLLGDLDNRGSALPTEGSGSGHSNL